MDRKELIAQGQQMMRICNSCRYCEGLCAVWRSMEYRREFSEGDLHYLANLCHDCSECYYACQYAPPHEWDINPPRTFAKIRTSSYEMYAWPKSLATAFRANGLVVYLVSALALVGFILGIASAKGPQALWGAVSGGNFYEIVSHNTMVWLFGLAGAVIILVLAVGLSRFLADIKEKFGELISPSALGVTLKEALSLEYLDGGGWGCAYPKDEASPVRSWLHHCIFYGFLLCLAATTVGFIYDFVFDWQAPYAYTSLPVLLGTAGGLGLLIGPVGLLYFKISRDPEVTDDSRTGMDSSFLVLLALISLSGLLLLLFRSSAALGILLAVHLGFVMAFFVTAPYAKFVHGIYRFFAIAKYALERKRKQAIGH